VGCYSGSAVEPGVPDGCLGARGSRMPPLPDSGVDSSWLLRRFERHESIEVNPPRFDGVSRRA
jgi:hypothetical protein